MNRITTSIIIVLIANTIVFAQTARKKLGRSINTSTEEEIAPYVSAEGNALLYAATDFRARGYQVLYAQKSGADWARGVEVGVINQSSQLNLLGSYCLDSDGSTIYFTSKKHGGVGAYDIWSTSRSSSGAWSTPANLGKPVNSASNDISPSISPDGKVLYFTRCDKVEESGAASCCKIMYAERIGKNNWSEAKPLPASINTGCESMPKIMPDNRSLIFSRKAKGAKFADFYITRKDPVSSQWSSPQPLDYINNPSEDNLFASVSVFTDILYTSYKQDETQDIYMVKIPDELQPERVIKLFGRVTDLQKNPIEAVIIVTDENNRQILLEKNDPKDGVFTLILTGGHQYTISYMSAALNTTFQNEVLDLNGLDEYRREKRDIALEELKKGTFVLLENLDAGEEDNIMGQIDLDRLLQTIRKNPSLQLQLLCFMRKDVHGLPDPSTMDLEIDEEIMTEEEAVEEEIVPVEDIPLVKAVQAYLTAKRVPATSISAKEISYDEAQKLIKMPERNTGVILFVE